MKPRGVTVELGVLVDQAEAARLAIGERPAGAEQEADAAVREVQSDDAGAIATFTGTTRKVTFNGRSSVDLSAGALMAAFVPQVVKAWRGGDTNAISLRMYLVMTAAFALWLGYGLVIGPQASEETRAELASTLRRTPRQWIAQRVVSLSTSPTQIGDRHRSIPYENMKSLRQHRLHVTFPATLMRF